MSHEPLKKVLEVLTELKASMHDVANTSASDQLDEAIKLVQQCIENGSADDEVANTVILLIGKAVERLPSIAALIKLFSD